MTLIARLLSLGGVSVPKLELIQDKLSTLVKDKDLYYLRSGKYIKVEYVRPNDGSRWYTATFRNPKSDKEHPIWLNDIFYPDGEEYKPLLPGEGLIMSTTLSNNFL